MQQTAQVTRGKQAHVSHMGKRPPRLTALVGTPDQPHMHKEQHSVDSVEEWGDWVSSEGGNVDPIYVPPEMKRPGFAYQWITKSALGSEDTVIKRRMSTFFRSGWKPVPGVRGKGYFFLDGEDVPPMVELGGLLLVEKPQHIEQHARKLNDQAAKRQLRDKMMEVGMAAPANVRHKLVGTHTEGGVGVQSVPQSGAGVPD